MSAVALEPCPCGSKRPVRLTGWGCTDEAPLRYGCPDCQAEGEPCATDREARASWNAEVADIRRRWPGECRRCGGPVYPDGMMQPVTGLSYCAICADDMFG